MREIQNCRSCNSKKLTEFLDLGEHYLSDFRKDDSRPPKVPLVAVICEDCMLVQLKHTAESGDMYHENYGFKSSVSDSIKNDLKDVVSTALEYVDDARSWLDIASNDGYLLSQVPASIYRVGVDPITKYCKEAEEHADLIINDFFNAEDIGDRFDIVTSISCFYDMDDPNEFVSGVELVMRDSGVWVIQQNYLLPTMKYNAVDNFCAEHLEYYTLLSLESLLARHGLEVIDLSTSDVNGGSIRTIVAKKGVYEAQSIVQEQRDIEMLVGLDTLEPYRNFATGVKENIAQLRDLILQLNKDQKSVYILAASTRGSTIWQAAGLTIAETPYAVERNAEKVGRYFSAIGIPIISEESAREIQPDYMLVGPWFFASEIINREAEYIQKGGHLIIPLPNLTII